MSTPKSIAEIDLSPIPGKLYRNFEREWREEFIYFLLVDRFHDDTVRPTPTGPQRSLGFPTPDDFYGGTLRGVTRNLDYIAGLGCTAIWLSPVFENNLHAYHGYNINSYLNIDPNFGTKQDLVDLVDAAHRKDMRVILDVVINHSGDNWAYSGDAAPGFSSQPLKLDHFRRADRPVPTELRNENLYHRRGRIGNFDASPETELGDIVSLKDYNNDDTTDGSELINILIKAHAYWIREADVDGFRVDAIKHLTPLACARFCSNIREYAYSLGKRSFFLYGELATPNDDVINAFIGPNTSVDDGNQTVFFGIDSVLDFRLAMGNSGNPGLRDVIKGFSGPETLFNRLEAQRERALNRGELGRYLVTFVDNHDSFWQPGGRIGSQAPEAQIIAAIGYLLCALGTPCLYYGTEQGFEGRGGDNEMREAMFDRAAGGGNRFNNSCTIYQEIAKIAAVMRISAPLRYGRMYFRQISGDAEHFGFPFGNAYTLAFSRILYGQEALVAYNVAGFRRNDSIIVDADLHPKGSRMQFLYGRPGDTEVKQASNGTRFVTLDLEPRQFVILA